MPKPKTIKIYLIEGEPTGIKTVELSNWDGKVIVIPRNRLKEVRDREEVQGPAVYLLIGAEEVGVGLRVYVGEAETLITRLSQQETAKDYWQYALGFISKSGSLTKAHVKYLEGLLVKGLTIAARCQLQNQTTPATTSLPESDQADMNEFAENLELLTGALGWNIFRKSPSALQKGRERYFCKGPAASAEGFMDDEGFLVLKGSLARKELVESAKKGWVLGIHQALSEQGVFEDADQSYKFVKDYLFNSPSAAAAAVLARHANGWSEWKTEKGQTLSQIERKELA